MRSQQKYNFSDEELKSLLHMELCRKLQTMTFTDTLYRSLIKILFHLCLKRLLSVRRFIAIMVMES